MICEKCGAVLPDDAAFCGKCGTKVNKNANGSKGKKSNKVKQTRPAPARKKAGFNIYKITTIILAAACIALAFGWGTSAHDPDETLDNYEKESIAMKRAGIELSGMYVVGEDSELPAGRYNIYPPEGESFFSVEIYDNLKDARKKHDKDYNSYAIDRIYSLTRGYKLKAGQVVVIDYDSVYFELVSEDVPETSDTENTDAAGTDSVPDTDGSAPDAAPDADAE